MAAFPHARQADLRWRPGSALVAMVAFCLLAAAVIALAIATSSATILTPAKSVAGGESPAGLNLPVASPPELALFTATNGQRRAAGLPELAWDPELARIAQVRGEQLAEQHYFGHVDPQGRTMYTELLARSGYRYSWAGENLARNNFPEETSVNEAARALMASPGHRANMLAEEFTRAGVASTVDPAGMRIYAIVFAGK